MCSLWSLAIRVTISFCSILFYVFCIIVQLSDVLTFLHRIFDTLCSRPWWQAAIRELTFFNFRPPEELLAPPVGGGGSSKLKLSWPLGDCNSACSRKIVFTWDRSRRWCWLGFLSYLNPHWRISFLFLLFLKNIAAFFHHLNKNLTSDCSRL